MLDPFDYKEPSCSLSDGKKFYYPSPDDPKGEIPVRRIIEKLDSYFEVNDTSGAGEFLRKWEKEARELGDLRGEITIQSELMGYCRKEGLEAEAMSAVDRGLYLIEKVGVASSVAGATVLLNAATVYKTFGKPSEALELYERANKIYREKLDPDDERFAGLYNNSALALCDLGRYEEAEALFVEAASIVSQKEDAACDEAATYVNMAHMYEAWRGAGCREIAECMDAAWEILDSSRAPRNGYYAFVASKCAPSYRRFGDGERAKILEERSASIYERA